MSTLLSKSTLIPDEPFMNHDTRLQANLRFVSPQKLNSWDEKAGFGKGDSGDQSV